MPAAVEMNTKAELHVHRSFRTGEPVRIDVVLGGHTVAELDFEQVRAVYVAYAPTLALATRLGVNQADIKD